MNSMNKNTEFAILGNSVGHLLRFLGQANNQALCVPAQIVGSVLLFSAGHEMTGHQTRPDQTRPDQTRPDQTTQNGYKIPCELIWKFNLYFKSL